MMTLKIGIADYDRMKARTMAIVGEEHAPGKGEPKTWLASIGSFAKAPSGHSRSNLSRTLKTMSHYGLVELTKGDRRTLAHLDVMLTSTAETSA